MLSCHVHVPAHSASMMPCSTKCFHFVLHVQPCPCSTQCFHVGFHATALSASCLALLNLFFAAGIQAPVPVVLPLHRVCQLTKAMVTMKKSMKARSPICMFIYTMYVCIACRFIQPMHVDKQVCLQPHVFVFTIPCMHLEVTKVKTSQATNVIPFHFCFIFLLVYFCRWTRPRARP